MRLSIFSQNRHKITPRQCQLMLGMAASLALALSLMAKLLGDGGETATFLLVLAGILILPLLIMRIVQGTDAWNESIKEGFDLYGGGNNRSTCRTLEEFELRLTSLWDIVVGMTLILSEFAVAIYLGWRAYLTSGGILFGMVAFGVTLATLYLLHVNYTVCKTRRKIGKLLKRKF